MTNSELIMNVAAAVLYLTRRLTRPVYGQQFNLPHTKDDIMSTVINSVVVTEFRLCRTRRAPAEQTISHILVCASCQFTDTSCLSGKRLHDPIKMMRSLGL